MQTIVHKSESRGFADHGWLKSYHSFSFGSYFDRNKMNFGALRVLNDDSVEAARGFGTHPHSNMEIVSIPLEGDLEHKDSMGNVSVIREGDIQVMSAGSGITHSEYNKNQDKSVKFLQIWIIPNQENVPPRYDQVSIKELIKDNGISQILSPNKGEQGVWVHQYAWMHIGKFDESISETYHLKKENNGVYVFVLDGEAEINNQKMAKRDAMGIWATDSFTLNASSKSQVLLIEVPMKF